MTARVVHVSDLHIGSHGAQEPYVALQELAAQIQPDLVLATGDLTERGRSDELERAAAKLRSLGLPVLIVPGNHDIPYYNVPARYTRPFAEWERVFGPAEPVHETDELVVVGLNSVRPWRQQGGAVREAALVRAVELLRAAPRQALRVVAFHHHLASPPWRPARKRPLSRRGHVLELLASASAELVVGGHVHQASIAALPEFQAVGNNRRGSIVLATAPGLGRPRPHRTGEAQGINVYESDAQTLTAVTFAWDGSSFAEIGRRTFPRG